MRTIDLLFEQTGLTTKEVAEKSNLPLDRIEAIAVGRWTPSPSERQKIAAVFQVSIDEISWGHTMDPRNIRYRQYGLKEDI